MFKPEFMPVFIEALNKQCQLSHEAHRLKGFYDDELNLQMSDIKLVQWEKILTAFKCMRLSLINTEISEAIEGMRKSLMDQHLPQYSSEWVELADVLERLFDYCGRYGVPLGEVWAAKSEFNKTRPSKHGKQF